MNQIKCPVCNQYDYNEIITLEKQPLSNLALSSHYQEAMDNVSFDIVMCMCTNCSHVYNQNASIDNITYKQEENSTYYIGEVWKNYTIKLAQNFIEKYKINNSKILEIGCGDITFLKEFIKNKNLCVGYDPSYPESEKNKYQIDIVSDYFYPKKDFTQEYDVVILRHLVEHLENAKEFLSNLVAGMLKHNPSAKLFIEVPNLQPTLEEYRVNDFVYEHISYFSFYSLRYLLESLNLDILEMYSTFHNENIVAICSINEEYRRSIKLIQNSSKGFNINIDSLNQDYKKIVKNSDNICIWGAGGRGSSFLNIIKKELTNNEILVDSDERKFGKYVPIVGLQITDYKKLTNSTVDVVIITTSLGRDNILLEIEKYKININKIYTISIDGLKQYK
jgi:hypothetical protein